MIRKCKKVKMRETKVGMESWITMRRKPVNLSANGFRCVYSYLKE